MKKLELKIIIPSYTHLTNCFCFLSVHIGAHTDFSKQEENREFCWLTFPRHLGFLMIRPSGAGVQCGQEGSHQGAAPKDLAREMGGDIEGPLRPLAGQPSLTSQGDRVKQVASLSWTPLHASSARRWPCAGRHSSCKREGSSAHTFPS